ncbi:MAG: hypothetical protein SOX71_01870, partial [Candidatus Faecousia sp.]|nr:hypothetical protein [Candidatus Faecousia sp.]
KRNLLHHRIAFGGVSPAQQTYDTTALANCQAFFQNILQRFAVKFGDNGDFYRGTSVRTLRTAHAVCGWFLCHAGYRFSKVLKDLWPDRHIYTIRIG